MIKQEEESEAQERDGKRLHVVVGSGCGCLGASGRRRGGRPL